MCLKIGGFIPSVGYTQLDKNNEIRDELKVKEILRLSRQNWERQVVGDISRTRERRSCLIHKNKEMRKKIILYSFVTL
jgi:hypothetical protein